MRKVAIACQMVHCTFPEIRSGCSSGDVVCPARRYKPWVLGPVHKHRTFTPSLAHVVDARIINKPRWDQRQEDELKPFKVPGGGKRNLR